MDTREFRDLLHDRSAPGGLRPVPLDTLNDRIRSARRRRCAMATGAAAIALAIAGSITAAGLDGDGDVSVATGRRTATPQERRDIARRIHDVQPGLALQSTYWWNILSNRTEIAWPDDHTYLRIRPEGRAIGLYAACTGLGPTVNVTLALQGANLPQRAGGGDTADFSCPRGDFYELTIPASTKTVTVTFAAHQWGGPNSPEAPPSRPRTWYFAFYQKGAKVQPGTPATAEALPLRSRLTYLDQREFDDALRRLTRRLYEQAGVVAPASRPS